MMRLNRRNLLTSMAALGAGLSLPAIVRAEEDNFWDSFNKEKRIKNVDQEGNTATCLLYTSPSPRDGLLSRMPSSA